MSDNDNENDNSIKESQAKAGVELKRIREGKSLSLKDISTATKINAKTLEALEEGRVEDLPAKSFTRGFIRAYAQYLKVDPKPIIEAYDMDDPFITNQGRLDTKSEDAKKENNEVTPPSKRISGPRLDSFGKKPILVASIVLLILLVVGVKNVVDKYAKETVLPESVKTESGSVVLDNKDPEVVTVSTASAQPTAQPTVEPTAQTTPVPTAEPTVQPTPEPVAEAKPTVAPKAQSLNILVEALDNVELDIQIEGESSKEIKLEPGSVYEIKTDKKVTLEISDGGLVNITLNGRDRGIAGDLGQAAKVSFP